MVLMTMCWERLIVCSNSTVRVVALLDAPDDTGQLVWVNKARWNEGTWSFDVKMTFSSSSSPFPLCSDRDSQCVSVRD